MKKLLLLFGFLCLGMMNVHADGIQRIHGVINDPQGNPLEGVEVSATLRALIGDNPIIAVTDQDGQYTIDLPEGYFGDMIYWIKASVEDGETMLGSVEEFVPLSEDGDTEVNLTLGEVESLDVPDYRNEYLVLDAETGEPIEGATIQEFYRHYEHDNGIQKGEKFVTDEMGCSTTDNRISDGFCWHPSYVMVKAADYGTEKVYVEFVLGSDSQGGLEQVIIYMRKKHVGEDAGLVDDINTVNADGKAMRHYGVSGVEIAPNAKGLHIVNGKKILVK